jgi:hypothetical protein
VARLRPRILWSKPGNPPAAIARGLGRELRRFSHALRVIKPANELSGADRVPPPQPSPACGVACRGGWGHGSVTDAQGEALGNLYDED